MNKVFAYNKSYATSVLLLVVVVPAIALPILVINLGFGATVEENILIFLLCAPIFIMIVIPLIWAINTLSTKIIINLDGVTIKRLFISKHLDWENIIEVNRKAIFSGTFPTFGPPRDLEIVALGNKRIVIYYFIRPSSSDNDGIKSLEEEIAKKMS